ncbi:phosphoenolpyruvate carboxykinase (GTP) [Caenorhabditis elegans]|uniref:phosphoenolpyruvate carboxykinase (GTP) n=1 Tax=Caenorhabditis elegans TaxID=6239 RepID=Q9TYQ8_CAEEL|nr:phosphoenolpyruvate carboxykinase (GTP) [Caenorhabditis elegans]CCD63377.1 phosphoenolpyruvate carboxykinase (GTP) [Caenorhabditis elegans]|eukprot:NP_500887.1 Phosphoenolypyruvate CarboxyKinase [Caenorhabditis elegans]
MTETDCPTCQFPSIQTRDRLNDVCQFIVPRQHNTLIVPNFGQVPVLKGDLTWLSPEVLTFLNDCVQLMTPCAVRICNGSVFEAQELRDAIANEFGNEEQQMLDRFHLKMADIGYDDVSVVTKDRLDADPGISLSNASASRTSSSGSGEGIENVRLSSHYMSQKMFDFNKTKLFDCSMSGRTMYVVPFSMGTIGSRRAVVGVQITDDPVLVLNLRTTFRVLSNIWDHIAATTNFLRCVHTIGMPRPIIRKIVTPSPVETPVGSFLVLKHDDQEVWAHGHSFGRTPRYGKTFSVHAASWLGAKQGWLAESAAILAITNPKNDTIHVCYSSLTTIDSLQLSKGLAPGWKVTVVSEKSVWLHWHDGKIYGFSPENDEMEELGSPKNLANLLTGVISEYQIQSFDPQSTKWASDVGVPISALIFANRRHDQYPLILEANTWEEGVCVAAGIRVSSMKQQKISEESVKESVEGASPRRILVECPMLRADAINFSIAKYVKHWLEMGVGVKSSSENFENPPPPQIFFTNLYQEVDGKPLWPGGVDNARIFEYIYERCANPADLSKTISSGLGIVPKTLQLSAGTNLAPLLQVDIRFWLTELNKLRAFFNLQMECSLPPQLDKVLTDLAANL